MKASALMRTERLSDNEVAELIRKSGDGFLQSLEWKALREKVVRHYGGKCMSCGYVPKRGVNVDHIKPRKFFPELALEFDNLQVLCGRCNKDKGNRHMRDFRRQPPKHRVSPSTQTETKSS